jgi:hypothetical protein
MNYKSFASIGMLYFIIILFLSGLIIEVGEEILGAVYEDEAKVPTRILFIMGFLTAAHVLSGIFFAILSLFHIIKNRSALKNYIWSKNGKISKESVLALILATVVLSLALLWATFDT